MWISDSRQVFFSSSSSSFHLKCHNSLIAKISLKSLLISWEASRNPILQAGQSSTGNHGDSPPFAFSRDACGSAEGVGQGIRGGGEEGKRRQLLPLHLRPSCVTADVGFRVLSG